MLLLLWIFLISEMALKTKNSKKKSPTAIVMKAMEMKMNQPRKQSKKRPQLLKVSAFFKMWP